MDRRKLLVQAGAIRPGVMLERPSLLARPWKSANTVTDQLPKERFGNYEARGGNKMMAKAEAFHLEVSLLAGGDFVW